MVELVDLGRPWDVRFARPRKIRSARPGDAQKKSLMEILGTLEKDVLGTS